MATMNTSVYDPAGIAQQLLGTTVIRQFQINLSQLIKLKLIKHLV